MVPGLLVHIHILTAVHFSGHLQTVPRVFRVSVDLRTLTLVVAKPRPGIDDNYGMRCIFYCIFRYARHVLDIEMVVISAHRIASCNFMVYSIQSY